MIKMRKLQLRTISLILTLTILAGCVYSSAAADAVTSDHVDRQNGNLVERVYDSGNVTLSNQVKAEKNRIFTIKLNVKIKDIAKLSSQEDSASSDTGSSTASSSVSSAVESTTSSAPVSSAPESAVTSVPVSSAHESSVTSTSVSSDANSSVVSDSTSAAAESATTTTSSAPAAEVQPSAARTMLARAVAMPQPEATYEVRYYIQPGFEVVESSIPKTASLEDGQYVSWPNLTAAGVSAFSTDLQLQAVAAEDGSDAAAENTEDQSGVYQAGEPVYLFASPSLLQDETKAAITWKRSTETTQVAKKVANTNWAWSTAGNIQLGTTDENTIWNANGNKAAEWNYLSNANGDSKMDLRRFQGTFKIPTGFRKTDTVQFSSVNQDAYTSLNNGKIIPINDDIFIFCYKKGTTLTDANYLDYLAFWSGTSGPRDGRYGRNDGITFHGLKGNQSHNTHASYDLMHYTDGWYVDADLDNIGASLFRNSTPAAGDDYVIDIFTQEYAGSGGMDKPQLTFTPSNDYRVQAQNDSYQAASGTPANLSILENDKVYLADDDVTKDVDLQVNVDSLVSSTEGFTLQKGFGGQYNVLQGTTGIGSLAVNTDGTGTFTPNAAFTGNIKFKYTAACTQNSKTYTADAYVTISVKNLNLSKTASYTGNFNSATGNGTRTYRLGLSASVTLIGDSFEECTKPYDQLPDGTYYIDDQGTTAVIKTTTVTQVPGTTYAWYTNPDLSGSPVVFSSTKKLYYKTVVDNYSTVNYNSVNTANSYYVLLSNGSYVQVIYQDSGSYFGNYTHWKGTDGNSYYYYASGNLYSGDIYYNSWGFLDDNMIKIGNKNFCQKVGTKDVYTAVSNPTSIPDDGKEYYTNASGYTRVYPKRTGDTELTTIRWTKNGTAISTPTTLYQRVSNNAPIEGATVQDTIDPRFVVLNDSGIAITDQINNTILSNGGVVSYDAVAQVWKVVWENQTIPVANGQWAKTINVVAKSAFFGGNDIPTNVSADSYVSFTSDGHVVEALFNQPTVNVPIYLPQENQSKTIFLGEEAGTLPANMTVDVAAFNNSSSAMWYGKGQTGTISAKWYYDENCTNPAAGADPAAIVALIPSDTTPLYYKVTFTPNSSGSNSATNGSSAIGTTYVKDGYTINVVKGQLNLSKTITAKYPAPNAVHAAQSFVFKIDRRDTSNGSIQETFYEVITLSDNTLTGNKTITGLKKGYYTVTEQTGDAWRYLQTGIVDNDSSVGTTTDGKIFIGRETTVGGAVPKSYFGADANDCGVAVNPATVDFTNRLDKHQWLGDTTVAVNTIRHAS